MLLYDKDWFTIYQLWLWKRRGTHSSRSCELLLWRGLGGQSLILCLEWQSNSVVRHEPHNTRHALGRMRAVCRMRQRRASRCGDVTLLRAGQRGHTCQSWRPSAARARMATGCRCRCCLQHRTRCAGAPLSAASCRAPSLAAHWSSRQRAAWTSSTFKSQPAGLGPNTGRTTAPLTVV